VAAPPAVCPSCRTHLEGDPRLCPACGFTGAKTVPLFGSQAPPLGDFLDPAGLWTEGDPRRVRKARAKLERRFPQIRWKFCAVRLDPAADLPVFGFWLMNAAPLAEGEAAEQRAWTVLLVVNVTTGQAAAVPGYAAESWLTDQEWEQALAAMKPHWEKRQPGGAVVAFLRAAGVALDRALAKWARAGERRRER
jgi:hypothetical protein